MTGDLSRQGSPSERLAPDSGARVDDAVPALDQVFDGDSLYQLRAAVAAHAAESGLSRHRCDDLVMAVHELAANSVRHGPGHGRLQLWRTDLEVTCEVTDDGLGPDGNGSGPSAGPGNVTGPSESDRADGDFPWLSEPGHGLWLIRLIADRSTVRQSARGVTALVSFCLTATNPPTPPTPPIPAAP